MNISTQREGNANVYNYTCEGCQSEGELKIPAESSFDFSCPEGCGARYIQWQHGGEWQLMCVVKPIFDMEEAV